MAEQFKYIVIGGGMMGAAAARYLSEKSDGVLLIGPSEPADYQAHQGVFASHYDEARITRRFDADALWATFASRSIDRYREIEEMSGIRFYSEVGCLFAGPQPRSGADYLHRATDVARLMGHSHHRLDQAELTARFGQFSFPSHLVGYYEDANAGHINPRALVRAQSALAIRQGTKHVEAVATAIHEDERRVRVDTTVGSYEGERVLIAAGAFSNFHNLLPRPLDMRAAPRTVVFFQLDEKALSLFSAMPSTIVFTQREEDHVYILPPVRYPDGKVYLKLGGDIESRSFTSVTELQTWFRTKGDPAEAGRLADIALQLMPGLAGCSTSSGACVAAFTPTGRPYAGYLPGSQVAVLTGGNFVAAKSSDELGRLGAALMSEGCLGDADFGPLMTPAFQ
jgi:sarcosine oxidase